MAPLTAESQIQVHKVIEVSEVRTHKQLGASSAVCQHAKDGA